MRTNIGWCTSTVTAAAAVAMLAPSATAQVEPFREPPFAADCVVHQFAEGEAPPLEDLPDDDPLCVEYQKRDITVTSGGAVEFSLAEPARFAAALDKCQYWQQDHWSIQVAPDTPSIVSWDGSYWFDRSVPMGAAHLDSFQVGGQPASGQELADVLEQIDPDFADEFRAYLSETGGGGMTFIPAGEDTACPAGPDPDPDDDPSSPDDDDGGARGGGEGLPDTGSLPWLTVAGILALAPAARRRRSP